MIQETPERPVKKQRNQSEMKLQSRCFIMSWNEFPETRRLLFHVENELNLPGQNAHRGAIRRSEGIVKGVSDLILLIPRHGYNGLMIEMKTPDGYWRKDQQEWAALVRAQGYRYEVIRTEEDFRALLNEYLG